MFEAPMAKSNEPAAFVPAPCPQCGDRHGVVRAATTAPATSEAPRGMTIRIECPACHHVWLQPMPSAGKQDFLNW
jgi:hypothetical protein